MRTELSTKLVGILDHRIANTALVLLECTTDLYPWGFNIKQRCVETAQYCYLGVGHLVLKSFPFWLALLKLGRDMRETCPDGVVI